MIVEMLEQIAARNKQQPPYRNEEEVGRAIDALARLGPTTVYAFAHEVFWPRFDAYTWLGRGAQIGSVQQDSASGRYSLDEGRSGQSQDEAQIDGEPAQA